MITSFRGDYAFLSNFYSAPVRYYDVLFPTVENAFQAAKTGQWTKMATLRAPEAKRESRKWLMIPGWDYKKLGVMWDLVLLKFTGHLELRKLLVATGDQKLIEGNTWEDRYWGMVNDRESGDISDWWNGQNYLGQILMDVRKVL